MVDVRIGFNFHAVVSLTLHPNSDFSVLLLLSVPLAFVASSAKSYMYVCHYAYVMPHGPQATRHHLQRGAHSENGNEGLPDSRALVVLYKRRPWVSYPMT